MRPWILLTVVALAVLLACERRGLRPGVWVAKPLASAGFLAAALAAGALGSGYGRMVLAALILSWLGDVFLLARGSRPAFVAGLGSFLAAHLAYATAFLVRGVHPTPLALGAVALLPAAGIAWRWLAPHVPGGLRLPVVAYVLVITAMAALALGTLAAPWRPGVPLGALLFYVSDLAVARERFVAPSFWNRAWGLPCYYAAQLVLASTVA